MVAPLTVSVGYAGYVFEADHYGFVAEYPPGKNVMLHSCSPGKEVRSVAVGESGVLFVAYNDGPYGPGHIIEYSHGLKGCKGTVLGLTLDYVGGLATDKDNELIVSDLDKPAVDVVAPPYSRVNRTLRSGYSDPTNVTINMKNTRVFVADPAKGVVYVLDYRSGRLIAKLGTADGLGEPFDAVDGPNAAY